MLHIIFYSVIGSENKKFDLHDVIKSQTKKLIDNLNLSGSFGYKIGKIMPKEYGLMLSTKNGIKQMPVFKRDEIARYLSQ